MVGSKQYGKVVYPLRVGLQRAKFELGAELGSHFNFSGLI
jgi:hypothetical protein